MDKNKQKVIKAEYLKYCSYGFRFIYNTESIFRFEFDRFIYFKSVIDGACSFDEDVIVDEDEYQLNVMNNIKKFINGQIKTIHKELTGIIWIEYISVDNSESIAYTNYDPNPWNNSYIINL